MESLCRKFEKYSQWATVTHEEELYLAKAPTSDESGNDKGAYFLLPFLLPDSTKHTTAAKSNFIHVTFLFLVVSSC